MALTTRMLLMFLLAAFSPALAEDDPFDDFDKAPMPSGDPEAQQPDEDIDILKGIIPPAPGEGQGGGSAQIEALKEKLRPVKDMIGEGIVDQRAQRPQEEVLKILERLIEENKPTMSESEEEQDSQSESSAGGGAPGAGSSPGSGDQAVDKESPTGATDSKFRKGSNKMGELRKFLEERASSSWGKLPEKEREAMIQEMKEKLPKGSAGWVEGFSKRLASGDAK